jgi:hypothetical protein
VIGLFWSILTILVSPCRSSARLEAENAVLRHQLLVCVGPFRGLAGCVRLYFSVHTGRSAPLFARQAIMRQVAETERARAKEESQLDAGYRAALAIRSTIQFCAASMSGNVGR